MSTVQCPKCDGKGTVTVEDPTVVSTPTAWQMFAKYDSCPACHGDWKGPDFDPDARPMRHGCGPGCFYGEVVISTPGDDFLSLEMDALATKMRNDDIRRLALYDEIRAIQQRCKQAGFGEVYDTEPEWAIADFLNLVCDELGWKHVDRWEF